MMYRIYHRRLGTTTIEAHRYVQDGSGTRFYDANDQQIASFYDGEITSVMPAAVAFDNDPTLSAPAPEAE